MGQPKPLRLRGIAKGCQPRAGQQGVIAVTICLDDPEEIRAAVEAAQTAAGAWFAGEKTIDDATAVHILRPFWSNEGGAALAETLRAKQAECHEAAISAVKKLRDPRWRSPYDVAAEETAKRERLQARRSAIAARVRGLSNAGLDVIENLLGRLELEE